jgi:hypothetical protein
LPDLLAFEFAAAAGSQLGVLSFAIQADEDRQSPGLLWGEGEGEVQGEDHPVVAESKEGTALGGAQWVMVHTRTPDVASGLAGQSVIDGADQNLGTKR